MQCQHKKQQQLLYNYFNYIHRAKRVLKNRRDATLAAHRNKTVSCNNKIMKKQNFINQENCNFGDSF